MGYTGVMRALLLIAGLLVLAGCGDTVQVAAIVTKTVAVPVAAPPVTVTAPEAGASDSCTVAPVTDHSADILVIGPRAGALCDRWGLNYPLVPSIPAGSWQRDRPGLDDEGRDAIVCRKSGPTGEESAYVHGYNFTDPLPLAACAALSRLGWLDF